jgi:hypothetical protein
MIPTIGRGRFGLLHVPKQRRGKKLWVAWGGTGISEFDCGHGSGRILLQTNPVHISVSPILRNPRFFFCAELFMGLLDCMEFIQVDERFVVPVFPEPLVLLPL